MVKTAELIRQYHHLPLCKWPLNFINTYILALVSTSMYECLFYTGNMSTLVNTCLTDVFTQKSTCIFHIFNMCFVKRELSITTLNITHIQPMFFAHILTFLFNKCWTNKNTHMKHMYILTYIHHMLNLCVSKLTFITC